MPRILHRSATFQHMLQSTGRGLPWFLRALLVVWAVLFMLMALAIGLVAGAGLLLWSLARGRRPVIGLHRGSSGPVSPVQRRDDVVEGQAREIGETGRRIDR